MVDSLESLAPAPGCPTCGTPDVLALRYGEPLGPPGPGVAIGGCAVGPGMQLWQYAACRHEWGEVDRPEPEPEPQAAEPVRRR